MRAAKARPSPIRGDFLKLAAVAVAGLAALFVFPNDLGLMTRIVSSAFLVVSLDLIVGYAGIATLGQAALFGIGAYAAANANLAGLGEPLLMVAVGGLAGTVAGLVFGAVILRSRGLAQLVLTIALVQLVHEAANKLSDFTGGSDGLSGIEAAPILGMFKFDLYGRTGYVFALVLLIATLAVLSVIVRSPFGLKLKAIGRDPGRVRTLGAAVMPPLIATFALSGAVAGMGGAIEAISAGVVGLDGVSFERSAMALVMLVLGGSGSLYGAVAGTAAFMGLENVVSAANPFHWMIIVGVLLIAVVLFAPRGLSSLAGEVRRLLVISGMKADKQ